MTDTELHNLLKKSQNGDTHSFGLLYDHFKEKIYKFIFFRVGHKELAEDILSDTFVKAWGKIKDVNTPQALTGWIYQVARNNVIDYYRLRSSNTTVIAIEEFEETLPDSADPVDEVNLSVESKIVLEMMDELPDDQRLVLQYKFFEDLTNLEIAAVMNKTEGAIRVIQHRAIEKLKTLLKNKKLRTLSQ
jgi:RNA polymerase sigma-70 factor (ECF subfamily)